MGKRLSACNSHHQCLLQWKESEKTLNWKWRQSVKMSKQVGVWGNTSIEKNANVYMTPEGKQ